MIGTKKILRTLMGMILLLILIPLIGYADVPKQINYQGYLTDSTGNPVPDGDYEMSFAIYNVPTGGTALWGEAQTVTVTNGVYNVVLGQPGNELDPDDFDGDLYLGVTVGSDAEMTPSQPLTSVGYALRAAVADSVAAGAVTEIMIGDDAVTSAKVQVPLALSGSPVGRLLSSTNSNVSGRGVYGEAAHTGDFANVGGEFIARGGRGIGVRGESLNSINATNYGGYFRAAGQTGRAVFGDAWNSSNATNYGGYFRARGRTGRGVYGIANGYDGYGVYGEATGVNGVGVFGLASYNAQTTNYGGYFEARGYEGRGVYGEATGIGGVGVAGKANDPIDGYGGFFQGRVYISYRLGIGTGSPVHRLDVNGTTRTNALIIGDGSDIAEPFKVGDSINIEPGMVVSIDSEQPGQVRIADSAYDRTVAGIVSGANGLNTGLTMSQEGTAADGTLPVALTGRVYAWADASKGPIKPGDLLTTSDTPGHAMKVSDYEKGHGAVLGKSMTALKQGKGLVLVLISLQ